MCPWAEDEGTWNNDEDSDIFSLMHNETMDTGTAFL